MPEFDFHAAIKRLAEARRVCPTPRDEPMNYGHTVNCQCRGTGHIVPFASLRVECNPDSFDHQRGTCDCEDSGWVPEPDVEKACWRIHISHPYICYATTIEEELRDAEAWVKGHEV